MQLLHFAAAYTLRYWHTSTSGHVQVLIVIRSNFQDAAAQGRIENMSRAGEYTELEAREGFSRAKTLHGW